MTERLAVLVPGMLGSVLRDDAGEIWGESVRRNARVVRREVDRLLWTGAPAGEARLLEKLYPSRLLRWPKAWIWRRTLRFLAAHPDFGGPGRTLRFGYDWRQDLGASADDLVTAVGSRLAELEPAGGPPGGDVRLTFVTYSMGALVLRVAIGRGLLAPAAIERIVHVGAGLEGTPAVFAFLYRPGVLPFVAELSSLFGWLQGELLWGNFSRLVQSCPSIYQALPPIGIDYLYESPRRWLNPLAGNAIPAVHRARAAQVHAWVAAADGILSAAGIRPYTVYNEHLSVGLTEIGYRARSRGPEQGYEVVETIAATREGDMAVSKETAAGGPNERPRPVSGVSHLELCNSRGVVNELAAIL